MLPPGVVDVLDTTDITYRADLRSSSPFRVLPLTLETGEILPALVERSSWIPLRVATRWAVRRRRWQCMPLTLTNELRSVSLLYRWARESLGAEMDDLLEAGKFLDGLQLQELLTYLRNGRYGVPISKACISAGVTVARHASVIRDFLKWAVDPTTWGSPRALAIEEIRYRRNCLDEAFRLATRQTGTSERIRPLTVEEVCEIDRVIGPCRKADGKLALPLQFPSRNPFRLGTRLRNWLMYGMAIQCGLRRGELLKLRLDDLPHPDSPGLKIRRRAHDTSDGRRHRPGVKTIERALELSGELCAGLRSYLTSGRPSGRAPGRTPYLFVTAEGRALSITATNEVAALIAQHAQIDDLSWHSFRHTWAETLADELLEQHPEEEALALLRTLGGWKPRSIMPLHYTQNALAKRANKFLRERGDRLYGLRGQKQ